MDEIIQFLIQHGYALLFVWVFAEQIGLPIPAAPILLAAGALAGRGWLNGSMAFGLAVMASLLSDTLWYLFGRLKGGSVLSLVCRISLNPDSCVRRTLDIFSRYGARSLLVAKFIPGINTVAPSMSGVFRMHPLRFLLFDGLGVCFWVGLFSGLGYLFSGQLEEIAYHALRLGTFLLVVVVGSLAAYIIVKYSQRRRFLRHLRIARITPEELKSKLDAGEDLMILDVRHSVEFKADPQTIPGALFWPLEQLQKGQPPIPPEREVILYCN
jgi:membrane protein DedA with SNARE-associated domain